MPSSNETTASKLRQIATAKGMPSLLFYVALYISINYIGAIMTPSYAAKWFAHCNDNSTDYNDNDTTDTDDNDCKYDYVTYNFYNTLFLLIQGLFLFFV